MYTTDVSRVLILAQKFFCLEIPFTLTELKKAYRKASRELHPDMDGGDEEDFKAMQSAYEFISKFGQMPEVFTQEKDRDSDSRPLTTTDGTPLADLGLGLGPTTNGKDCESCGHTGYNGLENLDNKNQLT